MFVDQMLAAKKQLAATHLVLIIPSPSIQNVRRVFFNPRAKQERARGRGAAGCVRQQPN